MPLQRAFTRFVCFPAGSVFPITRLCATEPITCRRIAGCTGSLTDVALRYAGQEATTSLTGTFEVISLNGTLELTGEHLHLAVSDPYGVMLGGHMMRGVPCVPRWNWLSASCQR